MGIKKIFKIHVDGVARDNGRQSFYGFERLKVRVKILGGIFEGL